MGHWSSDKYSIDYEDEDGEEVNQLTSSPEREEESTEDDREPTKDDGEPANDEEEEAWQATEEEAPTESNKKRMLNPPSPNMIVEDKDESSSE